MTAFYMFRLLYLTFFKEFRGTEEQKHHLHESPSLITFPLIVLAVLATIGGAISLPGNSWLNAYLAPLFPEVAHESHAFGITEYALMGIAVLGGIIGIGIAYAKFIKQAQIPKEDKDLTGFSKVVYHKYYVDELYDLVLVKPINTLSIFLRDTIENLLSSLVFGFAKIVNLLGIQGKVVQSGSIGLYLFAFVLGMCAILIYLFLPQ
jgi:NADH-quinone oxidoreductase subunit L